MPICMQCFEAVKRQAEARGHHLTDEVLVDILWEATPYPAGCCPEVEERTKEFFAPEGTLDELMDLSMQQFDAQMGEARGAKEVGTHSR